MTQTYVHREKITFTSFSLSFSLPEFIGENWEGKENSPAKTMNRKKSFRMVLVDKTLMENTAKLQDFFVNLHSLLKRIVYVNVNSQFRLFSNRQTR